MELYKEILARVLEEEETQIVFPNLKVDAKAIMEIKSYEALQKIKSILEDDDLEDEECFMRIEKIVQIFEQLGSDGGNRHDFG